MSKFDYWPAVEARVIMPDDPSAASYKTNIEGWVSRKGKFFGKGRELAQWDGCTHVPCRDCGTPIPKVGYMLCSICRAKNRHERYLLRPERILQNDEMLYSETLDCYYEDIEDAKEDADEREMKLAEMGLVIAEPVFPREIDEDYWCDQLPDSIDDLPDDLLDAIDEFNRKIVRMKPIAYEPGKYRLWL